MSATTITRQNTHSRNQLIRLYRLRLEQARRLARKNSAAFAKLYLGLSPGAHQYEMARRADNPQMQHQLDIWARDHGKTTIYANALILRRICENPNIRILMVQKSGHEARKVVSAIKTHLEENEPLRQNYAAHWQAKAGYSDISNRAGRIDNKTGAWQSQRIYVRRTRIGKDPTLESVGVGGAITGGHFDLIICDDILDDENTRNPDRSQKIIEWFFGTVYQLKESWSKIIVVGTPKTNQENLYSVLEANPIWNTAIRPAIISHHPDEIDFSPIYERIEGRDQIVDVEVGTPDVQVLWPQRWGIEDLLLDYLGSPRRIWLREKMCDLAAMAEQIFRRRYFRYYEPDNPPPYRSIIQSWDTAFQETPGAAYSAMSEWGEAASGLFLRNAWREKLEWPELALALPLFFLCAPIRPDRVLIEQKASGQSAIQEWARGKDREAWLIELRRYIERPGAKIGLVRMAEEILSRPGLPATIRLPVIGVQGGGRSANDKVARAEDASVWYANGQIWHPAIERGSGVGPTGMSRGRLDVFEAEMTQFPDGRYADQVDSASQAILYTFGAEGRYTSGKV